MINEARDEAAGLLDVERGAWANAVGFERLVPAFDFAVGLGIVRRSFGQYPKFCVWIGFTWVHFLESAS